MLHFLKLFGILCLFWGFFIIVYFFHCLIKTFYKSFSIYFHFVLIAQIQSDATLSQIVWYIMLILGIFYHCLFFPLSHKNIL